MEKERYSERIKSHSMGREKKRFAEGMEDLSKLYGKECDREGNAIYIHIPFCSKICTFCSMRRELSPCNPQYADMIIRHIDNISETPFVKTCDIDAVYFGGGTPTSMDEKDLIRILEKLKSAFLLAPYCEITMETTLSELSPGKLRNLMESGLNRLSTGIQTFSTRGRKLLGRIGDGDSALQRMKEYVNTGLSDISMDLIYNYPGETMEELRNDINIMKNLDIAGFSLYSLISMENSILSNLQMKDTDSSDDTDDMEKDRLFFNTIAGEMRKVGFEFLEITKMVKTGRDSYRYIKARNQGKYTIPLGAGAGGEIMGGAVMNPIDIDRYEEFTHNPMKKMVPVMKDEYNKINKAVSSLQLLKVTPEDFPADSKSYMEKLFSDLTKEGYFIKDGNDFNLTDKGIFYGNNISMDLWNYFTGKAGRENTVSDGRRENERENLTVKNF